MKPGAEGGSLYVPGAGHFECRLTSIIRILRYVPHVPETPVWVRTF